MYPPGHEPRESNRIVKQVQGDQYQPYGPEDGWMFQTDPDSVQQQGTRFAQAIKNGIVALRREGRHEYAEDLGARHRRIAPSPPPDAQAFYADRDDTVPFPAPVNYGQELQAYPEQPPGLVDQYGNPVPRVPRQRATPPREVDFEPFNPQTAWEAEMRRAEARLKGEAEPEPEYVTQTPPQPLPPGEYQITARSPQPSSEIIRASVQHSHSPTPTLPEFLNADGSIPRRPSGATTVITLRNRDHVIECQEEVRDPQADHPHYGLPHLALVTTGKRGHRVFIGWHVEGEV